MKKNRILEEIKWLLLIVVATALFSFGFDVFLESCGLNCGGVSGLAMVIKEVIGVEEIMGIGAVAVLSFPINIPLFLIGYKAVGKRFFVGSLLGAILSSAFMQLFLPLEALMTNSADRLLNSIFGGATVGIGLGIAFVIGASTGGSDIAARLLKLKFKTFPIGSLTLGVDVIIIALTGIVYRDVNNTLYSAITLYITSKMIDMVVYRFDYSKVAMIISDQYEEVAAAIDGKLGRGVTLLQAQGFYKRQDKYVVLSAVKRHQLAELQEIVVGIDENAFIIVQEAHQVLGDGFKKYSENSL